MSNLPDEPNQKLHTISEVAGILGVSINTLRRWEASGKISVGRTPTGVRIFSQQDIESLQRILRPKKNILPHIPSHKSFSISLSLRTFAIMFVIGTLLVSNLATLAAFSPYPSILGSQTQSIAFDLKAKVGEFLVWLLPEDFKNKATSLSSSEIIKVTGENISLGESFGGEVSVGGELLVVGQSEFSDITVSGDLTVEGDTNLNTLTTNSITTSTLSVETSSFSGDLTLSSDTPKIVIKDTKTLSITDGTNTLLSLSDLGTTGTLEITQDINVKGVYKVGGSIGQTKTACGSSQYLGSLAVSGGIITSVGDCKDVSLTTGTDLTLSGDLEVGATSNLQGGATVNPASSSSVGLTVKGVSSQSEDLLQIKTSLDAVIARVDELGNIQGRTLESTVTTGTAPLVVASTTNVANLNASYVEGNAAATLMSQPQPNLILNSDFSRRNKWMTFMPETFTDTSGWTLIQGTGGAVASNILTVGDLASGGSLTGSGTAWAAKWGLSTWRDVRISAQWKEHGAEEIWVGKYTDNTNHVEARWFNGTFYIAKAVGGSYSVVTSVAQALTAGNWYWSEIEFQGTTVIAKLYNSGASPAAKSSATLLQTLTGTVSDSGVAVGNMYVATEEADLQIGGLATGDGGVYVEGWGPESWATSSVTFSETFTGTSQWTFVEGSSVGSVSSNVLTAGNSGSWKISAGSSSWKDVRVSAGFQAVSIVNNEQFGLMIHFVDANNYISAEFNNNGIEIFKMINGSRTSLGTTSGLGFSSNNWGWIEIEAQGTRYTTKVYRSGSSQVAKANATLVATVTKTIADTEVSTGKVGLISIGVSTPSKWGGISTGNGGVYVEDGVNTFLGTLGGQAIGFDESTDAGPLGKQWTMTYYIPAINRRIQLNQPGPDGGINSSTGYTVSGYEKHSGLGGSGAMTRLSFIEMNSSGATQATTNLDDSAETSWTIKTSSVTTNSNTRKFNLRYDLNPSNTRTGTGYLMLPQLEQGSVATPWRNAPADDGPIVWAMSVPWGSKNLTADVTSIDMDPNYAAGNFFLPWDSSLDLMMSANPSPGGGGYLNFDISFDGTWQGGGYWGLAGRYSTTGSRTALFPTIQKSTTAGKHRISAGAWALTVNGVVESGNAAAANGNQTNLRVVATRGKYDLAEEYTVQDETIDAGTVVRLARNTTNSTNNSISNTTIERATGGYEQDILGIVSTAPGITLSSTVELNSYQEKENLRPVALQGRVPVKVTSENGPVRRGDILTSSATLPGYAMKATKAGRSIGIAMEDFIPSSIDTTSDGNTVQTGKIMTFVNLSFYDPDVYLADTGELVIAKATTNTLSTILGDTSQSSDSSLPEETTTVDGLYTLSNINTKETIERIGAFNELFVANLKVGRLDATEITLLTDIEQRVKNLEIGTSSAILSSSISALLDEEISSNSSVFQDLTVLGRTVLSDLGITGKITSGLLSIDGLNSSISSLGDLKFKLPGGIITIDIDGNVKIDNNLSAKILEAELLKIGSKSSGSSVFPANTFGIEVFAEGATGNARILLTPTTITDKVLTVSQKGLGKFTVSVQEVSAYDINFDWLLVQ